MAKQNVPHENPAADSGIHPAATPAEHPSDVVIPAVGACPHDLRFLAASAIEALGVNAGDHASKERILEHGIMNEISTLDFVIKTLDESTSLYMVLYALRDRLSFLAQCSGILSRVHSSGSEVRS